MGASRRKPAKGPPPPHYAVREERSGNAWLDLFCGIRKHHEPARHGTCFDAVHYPRQLFLTVCLDGRTGQPAYVRAHDENEGVTRELTGDGARAKVNEVWATCDGGVVRKTASWIIPPESKGRPRGEPKERKRRVPSVPKPPSKAVVTRRPSRAASDPDDIPDF